MVYAGEETAVVTLVDLSQAVSEMVELLKVSISKHSVLETDLHKNLPPIRGSAAQLQQVVMNLVTNASEAIGEGGGKIRVVTRSISRDKIGSEDLRNETTYSSKFPTPAAVYQPRPKRGYSIRSSRRNLQDTASGLQLCMALSVASTARSKLEANQVAVVLSR